MKIERFNIRVYGLLVDDGRVLLADEIIKGPGPKGDAGTPITKFPGGGLEFGEGTLDCLVREVREEMGVEAFDLRHFYTTDHFQRSAYRAGDQIVSIYYTFRIADPSTFHVTATPFGTDAPESFRWLPLRTAMETDVTLPIDRVVLRMLIAEYAAAR